MTADARRGADRIRVERFLEGNGPAPDAATLSAAGLAPWAYARAPYVPDRERAALRTAFTRSTARHLAHKAALLPWARTLDEAGIDLIVFKGFYLAEFVYEFPAERPYRDIDVVVRHEDWPEAERLARGTGWRVEWTRSASLYDASHEEAVLTKDGVVMEVHRYGIDCAVASDARQRRVTELAWAGSREVPWEGTRIRALTPEDCALVGLVLARAWSGGDDWHLKPSDYLDLVTLIHRRNLTRDALERRAHELGCVRTLHRVLSRCDPWRERVDLRPPTIVDRHLAYLAVTPERGHLGLERMANRLRRLPGTLLDVTRQLPRLIRTQRRLGRHDHFEVAAPMPGAAAAGHPELGVSHRKLRTKERIVRGIKWGARLLAAFRDPCMLRSFALYDALQAEGLPVRLRVGRRTDGSGRETLHAGVEVEGLSLSDLDDVRSCRVDRVVA